MEGIFVRWRDAKSGGQNWATTLTVTPEEYVVQTLGWLLADEDDSIVVGLNRGASSLAPEDEDAADWITIPKNLILEQEVVRVGKRGAGPRKAVAPRSRRKQL